MNAERRECAHSQVIHVRKFVAYAKKAVNDACYYPPLSGYRYMVALALYSKCITVAEATLLLLDHGFSDEAFGMTRTLIDIFITLHYISNKDTDSRAQLYYQYFAKDIVEWGKVIKQFWPSMVVRSIAPRTERLASDYHRPHSWSGKTVAAMALEPDTSEVDPVTGKPIVHSSRTRELIAGLRTTSTQVSWPCKITSCGLDATASW
jgi:hypothetical protein